MRKKRGPEDIDRLEEELEEVRPFLGLAREIHDAVARVAAEGTAHGESLNEAIGAIPARERAAVARAIFDKLPTSEQWAVLERVFGDDELRRVLEAERAARAATAGHQARGAELAARVRAEHRLDATSLAPGEELTLGLFREGDVRAAVARGRVSATCARRVVLRASDEPGTFQVIEDVFNPHGGYFVTHEYDRDSWRAERLPAHGRVRVGSITQTLAPVLYPGGRVDVEIDGVPREGALHLGFAVVAGVDLFCERG